MSNVLDLIATAESMPPAPPLKVGMLPESLADYQDDEAPEVSGAAWRIETIQSADWALARLSELGAEVKAIDLQARAAKERIEKRAALLKAKVQRGVAYFEFKLLEYAEAHKKTLLGSGKKKSRAFVHGTVGWRAKGGRLVVKDEAALAEWLTAQPIESGLYRVRVEPEMRALQALNATTGEIPPGCEYESETDTPYVKADAPETALVKG